MSRKKSAQIGKILGVGVRIRKIRAELTQEEFGNLFGVQGSAVSKWEQGELSDEDTLNKVAEYGGLTLEQLLRGDQGPAPLREHTPDTYDTRPAVLDVDRLAHSLHLTRQFLHQERRRFSFSELQEAELASYIYEHIESDAADPKETTIARLAELIKRRPA